MLYPVSSLDEELETSRAMTRTIGCGSDFWKNLGSIGKENLEWTDNSGVGLFTIYFIVYKCKTREVTPY